MEEGRIHSFFEGTEKKAELVIDPSLPSLRERGREYWERIVGIAGARILSEISTGSCTAYLLSESSLFVFDHKLVMITCGRTRLPEALLAVLEQVPDDKLLFLVYERKNEIFPHRQPSSFFEDAELLSGALPGRAFRFGGEDEHHLFLFHLDRPYESSDEDVTFEILMYGLDDRARELFHAEGGARAEEVREASGLGRLLEGFRIDDHLFEPGGYSLNAIRGDRYLTVHVTPELSASYASLETNCRLDGELDRTVGRVLELFRPRSFDLVNWESSEPADPSRMGYRPRVRVEQQLSCGYQVGFTGYYRPEEEAGRALELPIAPRENRREAGPQEDWIEEVHKEILGMRFKVERRLLSGRSDFQKIDIVETAGFGKMLFNDDVAMISERDEFIYHEMIAHVPLFVHPGAHRVLVIGGGDGGTVREVIRHPAVEHCRLVEIDPLVVDGCRQHIPQTSSALDDPRVKVSIGDGVRFVAETDERYDLVIVDSTDPIGPATPLFGEEFYANVHRVLNEGGISVSQAESPFYEHECQGSMVRLLGGIFDRVNLYNYVNLTYPGGLWSFTFSVKGDRCPIGDLDADRLRDSGLSFEYYGADVHRAAFILPMFQARRLAPLLTPFRGR